MRLELISVSAVKDSNRNLLKLGATTETAFGKQTAGHYYMFIVGEPKLAVGESAEINLDDFEVVEREYTHEGETMTLKYLYPKR